MSYEYDVPFVDFITSFGENDGADKFFDVNTELEKLSVKETPVSRKKECKEKNERVVLKEVSENIKNIGSPQTQRRDLQILSAGTPSVKGVQKTGSRLDDKLILENLKSQISQGFSKPFSASRHKKHFQIVEEVDGKLCVKNDEIKHAGVPRTIPNQRTKILFQRRSFEERQKSQIRRREEQIKKVLQEEQRRRVFHANPIPNYLKITQQKSINAGKSKFAAKPTCETKKSTSVVKGLSGAKSTSVVNTVSATKLPSVAKIPSAGVPTKAGLSSATESTSTVKLSNSSSKNSTTNTFRARPAYVIRKQPFLPRRTERSVVKHDNVTLHSEKRAKARKEFDEKLRQHYKELEDEARSKMIQLQKQEKEEIAELRRKLVHKAQPVPLFKSTVRANSNKTRPKNCKILDRLKK